MGASPRVSAVVDRDRCRGCQELQLQGLRLLPPVQPELQYMLEEGEGEVLPMFLTTSWSTKAGFTDSICCSADSPSANCGTSGANDFIEIENSRASSASDSTTNGDGTRYCGRFFAVDSSTVTYKAGATSTVCTAALPFRMRVHFSPGEVLSSTSSTVCSTRSSSGDTVDECSKFRKFGNSRGTLGFQLHWWQVDCS